MPGSCAYSAVIFIVAGVILRTWRSNKWVCFLKKVTMEGKTVLITGANSGLGKEAAKELASRRARVIMACRNEVAANDAIADIRKHTSEGELVVMNLDLGSLKSIREFSSQFYQKEAKLDVLLLNAGIAAPMELNMKTQDGYEAQFGVNHLGHFLLANLLLDKVKSTPASRVVVVSSSLYKKGKIEFDNLNAEKGWENVGHTSSGYCNSKLANMLFARELSEQLEASDRGVYAVCPGWVYTGLSRYYNIPWWKKILMLPIMLMFMKTPHQGVQTILHCVMEEGLQSGGLYVDCKLQEWSGGACDMEVAKKLWKVSEKMVKEADDPD